MSDLDHTETATNLNDHPDVLIKPPYLYSLALIAAIVLELIFNVDVFSWGIQFFIGILLMSLGAAIMTFCFTRFTDAGTNIPTDKPAKALVTTGPYTLSRNPVYISLTMVYLGISLLFDLFWGYVLLIPVLFIMRKFVIVPEEIYLEDKFGQDYLSYKNRVRRWL